MNFLQFGSKDENYRYYDRPGAYGVIFNESNEIGIVEHNGYYFLPGGGIEKDESESEALLREVREETGFEVQIDRHLGDANEFQISFDNKIKFNQIGQFYKCSIIRDHKDQSDLTHVFKWVNYESVNVKLARQSHKWALTLAVRNLDIFKVTVDKVFSFGKYRLINNNELNGLLNLYTHLNSNDTKPRDSNEFNIVWNKIIADPKVFFFVAEMNRDLLASCHLVIVPNLTRGCRPYGVIENVVTHPDYRGKGIGKGILKYALNVAWAIGCYKVMLMTGSKKEWVHKFYEDAGFQKKIKTAFLAKP